MVSIDGTQMYGKYRGVLLIAMPTNANNKVLPLAFAVVDKESGPSWGWFLERLRISQEDVIADKDICVISVDIRVFKTQLQTSLEMMMDDYE